AILLLGSASQAATAGSRRTVGATLLGVPFIMVAFARYGVADAGLIVAAYLATAVGVTMFVSMIAHEERLVRRSREELLEGIDAIVWEARPYPYDEAHISGHAEEMLGFDKAMLSQPGAWLTRIPAFDRADLVRRSREAIDAGRDHELTYRVATASGELRYVRDRVRVEVDGNGRPLTARGVIVDITDEVRVQESNRNLAELVERVPVGLVVARAGRDGFTTVSVNPAYERLTGRRAAELVGASTADKLTGPGAIDIRELLADVRRTGRSHQRMEAGDLRSGGTRILALEAFPISEDLVGLNVDDVTDRVETARVLEHQALHDRLTGLPNRALLDDRLRHAIDAAQRDQRSVALLLLDLNQFKEVNDTLGHDQGDRLLVMVGERLRRALRAIDTVARLGGDEFAVLLTDEVTPRRTLRAAERVMACFDEPHNIDDMSLQCGASLGVAMYPEHGQDAETLRKHADIAMYAAKRRGGGVAVYDADRDQPNLDRMTLVAQLRHALDEGELVMHYQPVVELATARVVRVEALVRWDHPLRGLIGPGEFIDVAEVSGVIRSLTRWVLEQATRDMVELDGAGHSLEVAANVSVRNLYEPR
ncbi:MAG: diguanylate cyclase, partial [Actinobacteria bacterium]|nr:diguanylate cyclase [Actinomycetota bacterium]NIS36544.1 diguanylate cyclase [Actinomycetota bacterium]NIT98769.1 diguanylate cyclase [Actinomycetota bacterium]NIU22394.1 diguanylate cyclase [Actinomycetota bacterium]NIU71055.1 diguanylate cyclase [Actinomycetota bacterium]